ncbi:hypothetical protein GE061_011550 [Apolygus lucorum]|uniref:PH domain-containing protein n=1 Tax=Apolygus lucorum TaxID=248454 RepID=A0A8S9XZW2_APOLU|nr:hypothetical protein GE061_011550 [Apolygus lucorum]
MKKSWGDRGSGAGPQSFSDRRGRWCSAANRLPKLRVFGLECDVPLTMDYTSIIEGTVKFRDGKKWKSRWCVVRKISPVADLDCRWLLHLAIEAPDLRG